MTSTPLTLALIQQALETCGTENLPKVGRSPSTRRSSRLGQKARTTSPGPPGPTGTLQFQNVLEILILKRSMWRRLQDFEQLAALSHINRSICAQCGKSDQPLHHDVFVYVAFINGSGAPDPSDRSNLVSFWRSGGIEMLQKLHSRVICEGDVIQMTPSRLDVMQKRNLATGVPPLSVRHDNSQRMGNTSMSVIECCELIHECVNRVLSLNIFPVHVPETCMATFLRSLMQEMERLNVIYKTSTPVKSTKKDLSLTGVNANHRVNLMTAMGRIAYELSTNSHHRILTTFSSACLSPVVNLSSTTLKEFLLESLDVEEPLENTAAWLCMVSLFTYAADDESGTNQRQAILKASDFSKLWIVIVSSVSDAMNGIKRGQSSREDCLFQNDEGMNPIRLLHLGLLLLHLLCSREDHRRLLVEDFEMYEEIIDTLDVLLQPAVVYQISTHAAVLDDVSEIGFVAQTLQAYTDVVVTLFHHVHRMVANRHSAQGKLQPTSDKIIQCCRHLKPMFALPLLDVVPKDLRLQSRAWMDLFSQYEWTEDEIESEISFLLAELSGMQEVSGGFSKESLQSYSWDSLESVLSRLRNERRHTVIPNSRGFKALLAAKRLALAQADDVIQGLKIDLESSQAAVQDLQGHLDRSKSDNEERLAELEHLRNDRSEKVIREHTKPLEQTIEEKTRQIDSLEKEMQRLTMVSEEERAALVESITVESEKLKRETARLRCQAEEDAETIATQQTEIGFANRQMQEAQSAMQKQRAELCKKARELEDELEQERATNQRALKRVQDEFESHTERYEFKLQNQKQLMDLAVLDQRRALEDLGEMKLYTEQLEHELREQKRLTADQVADAESQVQKCVQQLDSQRMILQEKSDQQEHFEMIIKDARREAEAFKAQTEILTAEREEFLSQIGDLNGRVDEMQMELASWHKLTEKKDASITQQKADIAGLKDTIAGLERQLLDTQHRLEGEQVIRIQQGKKLKEIEEAKARTDRVLAEKGKMLQSFLKDMGLSEEPSS
eukprot:Clim_evm18s227 gene=Clim_evmTU18s227